MDSSMLISAATTFLAEKNDLLEKATISHKVAQERVSAARELIMSSYSVKRAEEEIQRINLQNQAEREELHGKVPTHPGMREMNRQHSQRVIEATKKLDEERAAGFTSEEFKKLTAELNDSLTVLREAQKVASEAQSFVKIFTAITLATAKLAEEAKHAEDIKLAKDAKIRRRRTTLLIVLTVLIAVTSIVLFFHISAST
jgi:hypothetical protein